MKRRPKDPADQRLGRPVEEEEAPATTRWWKLKGRDAQGALWAWADQRRSHLRGYNALDLVHEAIYEGRPLGRRLTAAAMDFLRAQQFASSYLNVLQSMVDTVVSRQGKRRPMPWISADDAEYSEKLAARRASRVLRRKMGQPAIERMRPMAIRDAVVRGDGYIKTFRNGGDVGIERFPRSELVFDDGESRGQLPRTIAQIKLMDRDRLIAMFPDDKRRIRALPPASRDIWSPYDYDMPIDADMVEVCEGWHLPSIPGALDGRTAIVVRDGEAPLQMRTWTRPRYPFARVQWTPSMRSFLGIGLIQQLAGSQNKVNELWADHQEALYWGSALKIFVQRSANVNKEHMRARHPAVVEYDGALPQFIPPDPASRQAMESLRWLIQQMYEISGISQATAASHSPVGPDASGKAIETVYDIESDRFAFFELQIAMGVVDVSMCMLDEAKEMAAGDDNEDEAAEGGREEASELAAWIREIDWRKFEFDGGSYHLVPEPVGFLPETRGGKLEALQDLSKIPGLFSNPMQMAALFDEPDIARANRHMLGPYRALERVMEMLGDLKTPLMDCVPTPYMLTVPGLAKGMAEGELGNAFSEGADDRHLGRYRWFLQMLQQVETMANPQAQGGSMPPGMPPGAGPQPGPGLNSPPGATPGPPMAPIGPHGGMVADSMGGATSMLAAGMPLIPPGVS